MELSLRQLLGCAFLVSAFVACKADSNWTPGRATWFDVGPDMSKANCHYSWAPTGRYVGAWSDAVAGFSSSCGKCYEVRCQNVAALTDGYGATLERSKACYDESKSVVITIVDACPCHYPNNQQSNSRWCCGDMNHIDLSQEAFEQLADLSIGVVGLVYREVDCSSSGSAGNSGQGSNGGDGGQGSNGSDGGQSPNGQSSSGGAQVQSTQGQQYTANWSGWVQGWSSRWGRRA